MEYNISTIFEKNTMILGIAQKSVYYFRRQAYKEALKYVLEVIDEITIVVEHVINANAYFPDDLITQICELLSQITTAKRNKDYVMLADVLDLGLVRIIYSIQELVINREDINDIRTRYMANSNLLYKSMESVANLEIKNELRSLLFGLEEPLSKEELIRLGYRIELTPSGVMTAVAKNHGSSFYLHSMNQPMYEAFLLAKSWVGSPSSNYLIYGFGLGYHVRELCELLPKETAVYVFESDIQLLKLSCAFSDYDWIEKYKNLHIIYDPNIKLLRNTIEAIKGHAQICIHYPSLRNVRDNEQRNFLNCYIPYIDLVEIS